MKTALKLTLIVAGLAAALPAAAQGVVDRNGQSSENAAAANANATPSAATPRRNRSRLNTANSSAEADKSGGTTGAMKNNDTSGTGTSPAAHH
jgi:hypothetical protein